MAHDSRDSFKSSPKRFHPRGLTICYEDRDIIVVDKSSGLLTVSTNKVRENTAFHLLMNYVKRGNLKSDRRVFVVHRLDRDTSGTLVFAKTLQAKLYLQEAWQGFQKIYIAVVNGHLPESHGVIASYLAENRACRVYSVHDPERGKLAKTGYKVLKESAAHSLLEIDLLTGRKNQIRVHLADRGCPVVGDKKYGVKERGVKRLALHAASLSILHPHSKQPMTFAAKLPGYFHTLMKT